MITMDDKGRYVEYKKLNRWHRRSQKADSMEIRHARAKEGIHRHYARMLKEREDEIDRLREEASVHWIVRFFERLLA